MTELTTGQQPTAAKTNCAAAAITATAVKQDSARRYCIPPPAWVLVCLVCLDHVQPKAKPLDAGAVVRNSESISARRSRTKGDGGGAVPLSSVCDDVVIVQVRIETRSTKYGHGVCSGDTSSRAAQQETLNLYFRVWPCASASAALLPRSGPCSDSSRIAAAATQK